LGTGLWESVPVFEKTKFKILYQTEITMSTVFFNRCFPVSMQMPESCPNFRNFRKSQAEYFFAERKRKVLVRYSGTQPLCRIMIKASTKEETRQYCEEIADVVKAEIGK